MTDKSFTKPTVVQDFQIGISGSDIRDGRVTDETFTWLEQVVRNYVHRFEPQVSPGKAITIHIRMETEK